MQELVIKFLRAEVGWIDFEIIYNNVKLEYCFSDVFESPCDLVKWAENIYLGLYEEFRCDEESSYWYFDYDGESFIISDNRNINNKNPKYEKFERLRIKIQKEELCKLIYKSIIDFRNSNSYQAEQWEHVGFALFLERLYGSKQVAIELLSKMTKNKIIEDIEAKLRAKYDNDYRELFGPYDFFDDNMYDDSSVSMRKKILEHYIELNDESEMGGCSLLNLKSEILENLL